MTEALTSYIIGGDKEQARFVAARQLRDLAGGGKAGTITCMIVAPGEPDIGVDLVRPNDGAAGTKTAITQTHAEYPSSWQLPLIGTGTAINAAILMRQF